MITSISGEANVIPLRICRYYWAFKQNVRILRTILRRR